MSCSRTFRVWAVLAVVALAAGCGGGDSATAPVVPDSPRPTPVASVEVTSSEAAIFVGASAPSLPTYVRHGARKELE